MTEEERATRRTRRRGALRFLVPFLPGMDWSRYIPYTYHELLEKVERVAAQEQIRLRKSMVRELKELNPTWTVHETGENHPYAALEQELRERRVVICRAEPESKPPTHRPERGEAMLTARGYATAVLIVKHQNEFAKLLKVATRKGLLAEEANHTQPG